MIYRWIGSLVGAAVLTLASFLAMPALLRVDSPEAGEEFHRQYAIYNVTDQREPFSGQLWDRPPCLDCDNYWIESSPSIPVEILISSTLNQDNCLLTNVIWNENNLPDQVSIMVPVVFTQEATAIYEGGVEITDNNADIRPRFEPYETIPGFLGIRSTRNHIPPLFPVITSACDQVFNNPFCLSDEETVSLVACLFGNQPPEPGHYFFRGTIVSNS